MRRREVIEFAGTALFAWPLVARAEQQAKIARLGFLGFGTAGPAATRVEALRAGLRDLGYVEGKNLVIEFRWSRTLPEMHEAAAELARMKVDVIFASSSTEVEPARRATSTIPIVFAVHADPVGAGHVSSLARPGGNTTGLAMLQTGLTEKRLELLKETVPRVTRVGVLWDRTASSYRPFLQAAEVAGGKLGLQLRPVGVSTVADYDGAFATMAHDRVGAVLVHASTQTARNNPPAPCRTCTEAPVADHVRGDGQRGGGRADELRAGSHRLVAARRRLHRQDPQGSETGRAARRPGFQVPADHQSQDRERARPDDPAVDPRARRRGHRVSDELFPGAKSAGSLASMNGLTWCWVRASRSRD
jgi:ABC-type uncharacterized transport system substrate-binding protein